MRAGILRNSVIPKTKIQTMYQRKVDMDMLNAVKSMLADVSSVSPLSEQKKTIACCTATPTQTKTSFHRD